MTSSPGRIVVAADWIRVPEASPIPAGHRPVYLLRRDFTAATSVKRAVLRITAQGVYEAFINGRRVGDQELTPGFTQYSARIQVQEFDVTDLVQPGDNAIAVHLGDGWFRGCLGFRQNADHYGTHVALLAELLYTDVTGQQQLATDTSWRVDRSHILSADFFRGQHEDRRLLRPLAYLPGFDDSAWQTPEAHEVSVELVPSVAPGMRRVEILEPVTIRKVSDSAHVVDFGQNLNGWVRLTQLGDAGTLVTLRHGEVLNDIGDVNIDHLAAFDFESGELRPCEQTDSVVSAGIEGDTFEPRFTSKGFQFVRVDGLAELHIGDIEAVQVQSDLRKIGGFTSGDERLNWLHDAAEWSFRGNALDIPTDCPTRERAGFPGDWQVFVPSAAFLYDVDAWSRKWLADVIIDQREDGAIALTSPAESDAWTRIPDFNGSAGWGDAITIVPMALYDEYGTLDAAAQSWEAAVRWVEFGRRMAADARHWSRTGDPSPHERYLWDTGFHWGEWLEPDVQWADAESFFRADKSDVATAYLAHSAALLAQMARLLGKPEQVVADYAALASNARDAWAHEFIRPDGSLSVRTQGAHARALKFGLVPEQHRATVAADLVALVRAASMHLGTGFLSTPFLLPVLADHGYSDVAYELLLQESAPSWLYMRNRGATTVWESWDGIRDDGTVNVTSLNHYSKGAVINFLHHYIAGLRSEAPGYREFVVKPVVGGGVTSASTWHDSPQGRIEVDWRIEREMFTLEVAAPLGCSARAVLPDGSHRVLQPGVRTRLHCRYTG